MGTPLWTSPRKPLWTLDIGQLSHCSPPIKLFSLGAPAVPLKLTQVYTSAASIVIVDEMLQLAAAARVMDV